jgi:hypothetical protein
MTTSEEVTRMSLISLKTDAVVASDMRERSPVERRRRREFLTKTSRLDGGAECAPVGADLDKAYSLEIVSFRPQL